MECIRQFQRWQTDLEPLRNQLKQSLQQRRDRLKERQYDTRPLSQQDSIEREQTCIQTVFFLSSLKYRSSHDVVMSELDTKLRTSITLTSESIKQAICEHLQIAWTLYVRDFHDYALKDLQRDSFYFGKEGPAVLLERIRLDQLFNQPWMPEQLKRKQNVYLRYLSQVASLLDQHAISPLKHTSNLSSTDKEELAQLTADEKRFEWLTRDEGFERLIQCTRQAMVDNIARLRRQQQATTVLHSWKNNQESLERLHRTFEQADDGIMSSSDEQIEGYYEAEVAALRQRINVFWDEVKEYISTHTKSEVTHHFARLIHENNRLETDTQLNQNYNHSLTIQEEHRSLSTMHRTIKRMRGIMHKMITELIHQLDGPAKEQFEAHFSVLKLGTVDVNQPDIEEEEEEHKEVNEFSDEEETDEEEKYNDDEEEDVGVDAVKMYRDQLSQMAQDNDFKVNCNHGLMLLQAALAEPGQRGLLSLINGDPWQKQLLDRLQAMRSDDSLRADHLFSFKKNEHSVAKQAQSLKFSQQHEWKQFRIEGEQLFSLMKNIVVEGSDGCVAIVVKCEDDSCLTYVRHQEYAQLPVEWVRTLLNKYVEAGDTYIRSMTRRLKKAMKVATIPSDMPTLREYHNQSKEIMKMKYNRLRSFRKVVFDKETESIHYDDLDRFMILMAWDRDQVNGHEPKAH